MHDINIKKKKGKVNNNVHEGGMFALETKKVYI
jgi:hypothetical protein